MRLPKEKKEHDALVVRMEREAVAGAGCDVTAFTGDWERSCAICPGGKQSIFFRRVKNARGAWYFRAEFDVLDYQPCAFRPSCTRCVSQGRSLYLHPQREHEALHERRTYQKTAEFSVRYSARVGIEGTLSECVREHGLRHSQYVGQAKTHLQHVLTGAALNFCRVFSWLVGESLATTRVSRFARLKPMGTATA